LFLLRPGQEDLRQAQRKEVKNDYENVYYQIGLNSVDIGVFSSCLR
jgi:hypothetical protein